MFSLIREGLLNDPNTGKCKIKEIDKINEECL